MSDPDSTSSSTSNGSVPRRNRLLGVLIAGLIVLALAPTIIAKSSLRDRLINLAVADDSFQVSTESASFGYLSPVAIRGFKLRSLDGSLRFDMDSMESDRSWLTMLVSGDDLGTFRFRDPVVRVVTGIAKPAGPSVQQDAPPPDAEPVQSLPTLVAEIEQAGVQVRSVEQQQPALDLQGIDFAIRIEQSPNGSVFKIDPTTILDEETLTPELCSRGVQLIAPMLSDVLEVEGKISLRIDQFSVPLGDEETRRALADIAGTVRLADVSVGLNNQTTKQLMPLLTQIGVVDGPITMSISRSAEVSVHVTDGRVHHQGLVFLLPVAGSSFEIKSSGSVGLDETLDLQLAASLPSSILGDSSLADFLTGEPIVIQVTGTVDQPEISLASTEGWAGRLGQLLESVGPGNDAPAQPGESAEQVPADPDSVDRAVGDVAESVLDALGGLLEGTESDEPVLPNLRDRIRSRRQRDGQPRRPLLPRRRAPNDPPIPAPVPSPEPTPI